MKKLPFLASTLLLLAAFCLNAQPASAAATEAQASAYIGTVSTSALDIIKNTNLSKPQKAKALQSVFNSSVDFPWVARFVMGHYWRDATDAQRTRYTSLYQNFLVLHYSTLFSGYTGASYKILYSRSDGDDEFTVGMQIQSDPQAGEPVMIEYKIRADNKNKFKIFDVIIEGVSMLSSQRSEFASILNSNGIDYLNDQLEKKITSIASQNNLSQNN
jgi:phospholipid transport system substrate-binding protein